MLHLWIITILHTLSVCHSNDSIVSLLGVLHAISNRFLQVVGSLFMLVHQTVSVFFIELEPTVPHSPHRVTWLPAVPLIIMARLSRWRRLAVPLRLPQSLLNYPHSKSWSKELGIVCYTLKSPNIFIHTIIFSDVFCIFLVQVRLTTEVLCNPSSTQSTTWPGFELMTSRSWQHISCHWDACSNHSAISDFIFFHKIIFSDAYIA